MNEKMFMQLLRFVRIIDLNLIELILLNFFFDI